jgi:fermentation-respiration switch protein FrsA (DUF1100 family)
MIYDWFREVSRRLQVNVMAYDYTGYGISNNGSLSSEPSEEAVYSDIEAAFAYLVHVKKTPPSRILLYGRSLGSGPTTYLAVKQSRLKQPVAGMILQSPLLSIFRVAFSFRYSLPGDLFCNVDLIEEVASPVTIIHGTRDEVVPFSHGEELFEKCSQEWRYKPLWVTDAGHNNIEAFLNLVGDAFFSHLRGFVDICHRTVLVRQEQEKKERRQEQQQMDGGDQEEEEDTSSNSSSSHSNSSSNSHSHSNNSHSRNNSGSMDNLSSSSR